MELYLDSVDVKEIEEAFSLGFLTGLTTTPTFMHRHGISDIDATIVELSQKVPLLHIESIGNTAQEIVFEAERLLSLGLSEEKTVFKIPVSLEGVKACKILSRKGYMVNVHLVYTLQQAYMAMEAGAAYVCPLVGRLQDQGHDALSLVEDCVAAVDRYAYTTRVMFSSVRHPEHVRNAINIGVHACTVPWKVMKLLTQNSFTTIGTDEFIAHTRLLTMKAKDIMRVKNPVVHANETIENAVRQMTDSGFGATAIVNHNGALLGIFTDGDLRRAIMSLGHEVFNMKMSDLCHTNPISVHSDALLQEVVDIFVKKKVDNIIVTENNIPVGMVDIQDVTNLNLI